MLLRMACIYLWYVRHFTKSRLSEILSIFWFNLASLFFTVQLKLRDVYNKWTSNISFNVSLNFCTFPSFLVWTFHLTLVWICTWIFSVMQSKLPSSSIKLCTSKYILKGINQLPISDFSMCNLTIINGENAMVKIVNYENVMCTSYYQFIAPRRYLIISTMEKLKNQSRTCWLILQFL